MVRKILLIAAIAMSPMLISTQAQANDAKHYIGIGLKEYAYKKHHKEDVYYGHQDSYYGDGYYFNHAGFGHKKFGGHHGFKKSFKGHHGKKFYYGKKFHRGGHKFKSFKRGHR